MIDEKKLIEDIDNCVVGLTNIQMMQIADIIETQPKVGEWIPCSERLPEENVPVLTCGKHGWISVNINVPYNGVKNDFECGYYVAWQPLPEPYKGVD